MRSKGCVVMIDPSKKISSNELGTGSRIFSLIMGCVWVGVGFYGVYGGVTMADSLYLAILGALAIVYGALWLRTGYRGKWGRVPLWP